MNTLKHHTAFTRKGLRTYKIEIMNEELCGKVGHTNSSSNPGRQLMSFLHGVWELRFAWKKTLFDVQFNQKKISHQI